VHLRLKAALALWRIDPREKSAVVAALISTLRDNDLDVRGEAIAALGHMGPAASEAVPTLGKALLGLDAVYSHFASLALGQIGKSAVGVLIDGMKSDRASVRWDSAVALGQIGADARAAVPQLIAMLDDKDPIYRTQAATSLGQIGPGAKEAVPALIKALKDRYYTVRQFAAQALGDIGPAAKAAIPQLTAALKDPADEVSDAAEDAIEKIKGKEK